jgi:hypothetical protein
MYDNDDWSDWYDDPDYEPEPGEGLREYWLNERADAYHDYMSDEEYDNE